jgi:hypothetical protein
LGRNLLIDTLLQGRGQNRRVEPTRTAMSPKSGVFDNQSEQAFSNGGRGMTPKYLKKSSRLDSGKRAMAGTLRVSRGPDDLVSVEFVPVRPQNRIYRATARSQKGLKKQLDFLGVSAGQQARILAAHISWCREVTLIPSPAAWVELGGGGRTGAG